MPASATHARSRALHRRGLDESREDRRGARRARTTGTRRAHRGNRGAVHRGRPTVRRRGNHTAARSPARSAARDALGAELGVGIEGGVVEQPDGTMRTCAWAAIVDASGRSSVGGSLAMALPRAVAEMVRGRTELGHAMDALIGAHDSKRGKGAVGILTAGLVDRQGAYETLMAYAAAPFLTPELYARQPAGRIY